MHYFNEQITLVLGLHDLGKKLNCNFFLIKIVIAIHNAPGLLCFLVGLHNSAKNVIIIYQYNYKLIIIIINKLIIIAK